jgi:hypothetical protein
MLLHVVTRNSVGILSADAFTQANPPVVTASANKSTTLASITKVGVLGGSIAFTRPDQGSNIHGGPVKISGSYNTGLKPLGVYLNDAVGNAFENTPGVASGRGPYVCGSGSCIAVSVYETQHQKTGSAAITYANGDKVYASVNGLFTNVVEDGYEDNASAGTNTLMGIVKDAPSASSPLLVIDLRV